MDYDELVALRDFYLSKEEREENAKAEREKRRSRPGAVILEDGIEMAMAERLYKHDETLYRAILNAVEAGMTEDVLREYLEQIEGMSYKDELIQASRYFRRIT